MRIFGVFHSISRRREKKFSSNTSFHIRVACWFDVKEYLYECSESITHITIWKAKKLCVPVSVSVGNTKYDTYNIFWSRDHFVGAIWHFDVRRWRQNNLTEWWQCVQYDWIALTFVRFICGCSMFILPQTLLLISISIFDARR